MRHLPAVLLIGAGLAIAQRPSPTAHDWALEISWGQSQEPPGYSEIPERGTGLSIFHRHGLKWQPGWDGSDQARPHATGLKLAYSVAGDAVSVEAFVVLGPYDEMDTPRSLGGVPQESAAKLLLRLDDPATSIDLAKYGLEPISVRVVPNKPPVPAVPKIVNDTAAIRVESVDQDRSFYRISLRNVSAKNITDLVVSMPEKDGALSSTLSGRPLIAPGAVHQMTLGRGMDPAATTQIVVAAALFFDGSFEGSAEWAATMEAQHLGAAAQKQRVRSLVQSILDHGGGDDVTLIAAIRSQVSALAEEVDPAMLQALMQRYPGLAASGKSSLEMGMKSGLHTGRESVLFSLRDFERNPHRDGYTLRDWWNEQTRLSEAR